MLASISLNGAWSFRFEGDPEWVSLAVPGCWDACGPKDRSGPAWYRRAFTVPPGWSGRRIWLRFDAVSYACDIRVNGREAARHVGAWDGFDVEITTLVTPGAEAELLVRVEKPAGLTRGPDSEPLPGDYPLRETLAGFLPYVWGHLFGGVWQDVTLYATGRVACTDFCVRGTHGGHATAHAHFDRAAGASVTVEDARGEVLWAGDAGGTGDVRFDFTLARPEPWSPVRPAMYTARLELDDGDTYTARFGLRALAVDGATLLLNGRPLYPRMVLSWGWYPESLHSNPGPDRVRRDLVRLKALGFNGVKLCLWFPPEYYFDLADELGMLLWVELPMWLPQPTAPFRAQAFREYDALVRRARRHPAVILYTLGCELDRTAGADLLGPLYTQVKALAGDALVRDNSGSGEAYGGLLDEFADFYDHHFYSELHFFRALLDEFAPRWRAVQPWLFGEFCDADTFRDVRRLRDAQGAPPWWARADETVNPQGARWQYDLPEHDARLRAAGLRERGADLERLSAQQAAQYRKFVLELTRAYREISGYVVTGEADTPISTAGMWDDAGRLKFDPAGFRESNADTVVLLGWDRRREWVAGGDRPAPLDTFSYGAGETVRAHVLVSHYGADSGPARAAWSVTVPDGMPFAAGESMTAVAVTPGALRELAVAEFVVPDVSAPCQAVLRAVAEIGGQAVTNEWPLWFFPRVPWSALARVALVDPAGRLAGLRTLAPDLQGDLRGARAAVATEWTAEVAEFVSQGGHALVLQDGGTSRGPLPIVALPFWREALRLVEPHLAWGDFPHAGWAGLQFFGCATDRALDTGGASGCVPLLRRLDLRTMRLHDYAVEWTRGRGRTIVTTLRFAGGQGRQPAGLARNTAAAYLLYTWLRHLGSGHDG